ncbi:MAG: redoxin domain-containing protein [Pseudomonadales bacterium]|nr:TlpA family protein disulfide reductase [Pseudomonadales bacterium]NIX07952.1 redoxin domain-containing protein [Pseudomonadales bacterium]
MSRLAAAFASLLLTLSALSSHAEDFDGAQNQPAPDFTLPNLLNRDESIRLSDFRGKTVYLDFWSAWCVKCRKSMPLLTELNRQLGGQAFAVVSVNIDVNPRDGMHLLEQMTVNYPVASDVSGRAADRFGAVTLPATYLIDAEGNLRPSLPTMNEQNFSAIKARLAELIERDKRGTFET